MSHSSRRLISLWKWRRDLW